MSAIQNFCNQCAGNFSIVADGKIRVQITYLQKITFSLFSNADKVLQIKVIEEAGNEDITIFDWFSNQANPGPIIINANYKSKIIRFEGFENSRRMKGQMCRCSGGLQYKIGYDDSFVFGDGDYDDIGADIYIANSR